MRKGVKNEVSNEGGKSDVGSPGSRKKPKNKKPNTPKKQKKNNKQQKKTNKRGGGVGGEERFDLFQVGEHRKTMPEFFISPNTNRTSKPASDQSKDTTQAAYGQL